MKKLKAAKSVLGMITALIFVLVAGSVCAQEQAIKMEDLEKLAKEALANAEGTRKIVAGVIEKVEKEMPKDASSLLKGEVDGAKMWFKKGDDLLAKCKKQIEEKKFTKELVIDLNQAWRWLVEAGSEIVRASMME
ncbi:hypothetical protein [Desulfomonile tiedjei]|uniref:Uncharacterized protein n=1 Tax=Desulfomonile tiedjei (strain ATCC 49306 / DSM 6799 / DCB-1) TaxID=706587 RepID=I4C1E4_DESTA|nr:hypothetical protein [Desulfomonile tiedjei]AFM23385.1 hypothetical protein Desti_0659 [Desulfomonile tiedjei DSM 6799]